MRKLIMITLIALCTIAADGRNAAQAADAVSGPTEVEKPVITFGILADTQYTDRATAIGRYYRTSLRKLDECVQEFNSRELTFVIQLGDLIDRKTWSFDPPLSRLNRLNAPKYHVLGNHDFVYNGKAKQLTYGKLGLDKGYYDFSYKSWRFVVLDGNDISFQSNAMDSADYSISSAIDPAKFKEAQSMIEQVSLSKRPNAQQWNGGIGNTQLEWLKTVLEKSSKSGENVIIFCHFPVYPTPGGCNLWNEDEVAETVEGFDCVKAWFNGHNHEGAYGVRKGMHYVTIEGMVETADTNAFGIVEIYNDRLNIIGFGRTKNRTIMTR